METYFFHYTDQLELVNFIRDGMYRDSSFTVDEYYNAAQASQRLGIPPPVWVLKFKGDAGFRRLAGGIVASSNRYNGGGTQFVHLNRVKPIAKRRIYQKNWTAI